MVGRHDVRARLDAEVRAFRALTVLRACCAALGCLCGTFVFVELLRGIAFGALVTWLVFAMASFVAAALAPRAPWVGAGAVALLTGSQILSLLAAPSASRDRIVREVLSREFGWQLSQSTWATLLPRVAIVCLGLVALGFIVFARRDLGPASWPELIARRPQRNRTHLLLVGAGLLVGMVPSVAAWGSYRREQTATGAAAEKREATAADMKSAFRNAWNAADLKGIVACFPEGDRPHEEEVLPAYMREHGYGSWPKIEVARESGDDFVRRVYFREVGSAAGPFLLTEWEMWGPRLVLRGIRVRKR